MNNTDKSIQQLQKNLPMLRKLYGWTMEQLGDRIGVTKQTISNLERGNPKMTKIQYIAIRSIFEAEAHDRSEEERANLLGILSVVCDDNPEVTDEQREKTIEMSNVVAGAAASGVAITAATSLLTSSLSSLGIIAAAPVAGPILGGVTVGAWISRMLKAKKESENKEKQ